MYFIILRILFKFSMFQMLHLSVKELNKNIANGNLRWKFDFCVHIFSLKFKWMRNIICQFWPILHFETKYYLLSVVSLLQQTSRRIELIKDLNAFVSGELKWAVTFFLFSTFVHILKHFFFLLELIAYKAKWHRNLNEPKIIIIENWY